MNLGSLLYWDSLFEQIVIPRHDTEDLKSDFREIQCTESIGLRVHIHKEGSSRLSQNRDLFIVDPEIRVSRDDYIRGGQSQVNLSIHNEAS